jgi:F0F1-type ATP synthase membrane subunit b/b'
MLAAGLSILWVIIIIVIVLAVLWYFFRGRGTA